MSPPWSQKKESAGRGSRDRRVPGPTVTAVPTSPVGPAVSLRSWARCARPRGGQTLGARAPGQRPRHGGKRGRSAPPRPPQAQGIRAGPRTSPLRPESAVRHEVPSWSRGTVQAQPQLPSRILEIPRGLRATPQPPGAMEGASRGEPRASPCRESGSQGTDHSAQNPLLSSGIIPSGRFANGFTKKFSP